MTSVHASGTAPVIMPVFWFIIGILVLYIRRWLINKFIPAIRTGSPSGTRFFSATGANRFLFNRCTATRTKPETFLYICFTILTYHSSFLLVSLCITKTIYIFHDYECMTVPLQFCNSCSNVVASISVPIFPFPRQRRRGKTRRRI